MVRRSCLAGLFMVLAIIFTFAGCSSNSTDNNQIIGDPNSPDFQNMKAAIQSSVDSTLSIAMRFAGDPGKAAPEDTLHLRPDWGVLNPADTLLYNYVDGWNVVYLGLTTGTDYNRVYVDSVRFWLDANTVDRYFSYHVSEMDYIHHQTNTYKGTGSEYQNTTSYLDVVYTNYTRTDGDVEGAGKFVLDDYYQVTSGTAHDKYEFDVTFDGLAFVHPDGEPWTASYGAGGSLTMDVTVTKGQIAVTWTVEASFDAEGTVSITAHNGNVVYSYSITPTVQ